MNVPPCTECDRPLLLSNSSLMCVWRHCPAYGQDQSEDYPAEQHTHVQATEHTTTEAARHTPTPAVAEVARRGRARATAEEAR